MKRVLILTALLYIFTGCDSSSGGSTVYENSGSFSSQKRTITIDDSSRVYRINNVKSSDLKLTIHGQKDIYVVVTSKFNNQKVSINSPLVALNYKSRFMEFNDSKDVNTILMRQEINNILFSKTPTLKLRQISQNKRVISSVNSSSKANFCIGMKSNRSCSTYINASVKKVVKNIDTKYGKKSLVIWLEDGNNLSQSAVDDLADTFLKSGSGNDIYDWVTNVFGKEWGSEAREVDSKLIAQNDIIDILIYDMANPALAGYYWGKDNFSKSVIGASNEKIMFYLNSELLKRDPKETYTTLTHEFQHMIHFYQRSVIKGIEDSAWYDELMSEATEDLISTKIRYFGPRHVDPDDGTAGESGNSGGRFPNFNRYNRVPLTTWQNSSKDYSKVSAFGTYLLRNYGGAEVLHKLMYSNNQDEYALLDATKESNFGTLIANWGSAVMLSDIINPGKKYEYNFGDFKYTTYNDITYELGSINFFNYNPMPQFKSSATLNKDANLYYKVGSNLSGFVDISIQIEKGADITIIAK